MAVISPPILFPKNAFDELCKSGGDTGAKGILASDKLHVRSIEFPPAQKDVDTPEDLQDLAQD